MSENTSHPAGLLSPPLDGQPLSGYCLTVRPPAGFESRTPPVPLSHYLWVLRRHPWRIVAFVAACVLAAFIVCSRIQPIYESTAVIDIDRQAPSAVVGQDAIRPSMTGDAEPFLATQVKLVTSNEVLRPVATRYNLLEREDQFAGRTPEEIRQIRRDAVVLKRLKVSRPPKTYLLLISYRATDPDLAASVANAIANSYVAHTYEIRTRSSASLTVFMEQQLDQLRAKMELSGQALAKFEKELNLINPEEKTNILSARLLQLNTEYTNAEADRVRKEAAYNSMKSGTLEAAQVSSQGESLLQLTQHLDEAQQRFAEVKTTFGTAHPEYQKAAARVAELRRQLDAARHNTAGRIDVDYRQALNREQMLRSAVVQTKAESDRLNARSFEYQQLKHEAEGDRTLYEELIRKIREANINAGFQNTNIRIADTAQPGHKPVFPNMPLTLVIVFLGSTFLAVGAAFAADAMDNTLRDPEQASHYLETDVVGILPLVRKTAQLQQVPAHDNGTKALAKTAGNHDRTYRNGCNDTVRGFAEAIRTLRSTIRLGDFDSRLHSILITSADAGEGKTTTSIYLAIANAEQGKKTLLVDADLRRPGLLEKFGMSSERGLANVLLGECSWKDVLVHPEGRPNLTILPAGPASNQAADLVGARMTGLIDELVKEYDPVILDGPPLLGFAEPLEMATAASGVLLVSRAGKTNRKVVSTALATLRRLRAHVIGVALNQVQLKGSGAYPYHYGYYQQG